MRNVEKEKAYQMMAEYIREFGELNFVDFYQEVESGVTVCYANKMNKRNGTFKGAFGFASCNEGDTFNTLTGKYLALKRAAGGKVPKFILEKVIHA